jgi:centractin
VLFPNLVGKPRFRGPAAGISFYPGRHDAFIGDRAQEMRGILSLKYPIEAGIIEDWDSMEMILDETYKGMAQREHKAFQVVTRWCPGGFLGGP